MSESKREKFVRLAENRMNNALKQIELLANLANASVYEYTSSDIEKILKTLKNAVSDLEHSYKMDKKTKRFSL